MGRSQEHRENLFLRHVGVEFEEGEDKKIEERRARAQSRLWLYLMTLQNYLNDVTNAEMSIAMLKNESFKKEFPELYRHMLKANQTTLLISLAKMLEHPKKEGDYQNVNISIYSFLNVLEEHHELLYKDQENNSYLMNGIPALESIESTRAELLKYRTVSNSLFAIRNKLNGHVDYQYVINPNRILKDMNHFQKENYELIETCRRIIHYYYQTICYDIPEGFENHPLIMEDVQKFIKLARKKRPK